MTAIALRTSRGKTRAATQLKAPSDLRAEASPERIVAYPSVPLPFSYLSVNSIEQRHRTGDRVPLKSATLMLGLGRVGSISPVKGLQPQSPREVQNRFNAKEVLHKGECRSANSCAAMTTLFCRSLLLTVYKTPCYRLIDSL
jgi:hypothetical protein